MRENKMCGKIGSDGMEAIFCKSQKRTMAIFLEPGIPHFGEITGGLT